jgi:hypothetical protein
MGVERGSTSRGHLGGTVPGPSSPVSIDRSPFAVGFCKLAFTRPVRARVGLLDDQVDRCDIEGNISRFADEFGPRLIRYVAIRSKNDWSPRNIS